MIRAIIVLAVVGVIAGVVWWDRSDAAKKRQIFFSLYNKALAKAKNKKKVSGISVSTLDVMDETDIGPTMLHIYLKSMERSNFVKLGSNSVKLTPEGVAWFKLKYHSESPPKDEVNIK